MAGRPLVHAAENMAAEKGGRIAPRLVFRLLGRRSLVHGIGHAYGFPSFLSPAPAVPPTDPWEVIWLQNAFCSCSQPWRPAGSQVLKSCSGSMRSEEHTSELQSLMRISYAVFCLKKKKNTPLNTQLNPDVEHRTHT